MRLPSRSPNLNAYAERFVLSIKSECLDRMVLIGERHLRKAVGNYVEHYHLERPRPTSCCMSKRDQRWELDCIRTDALWIAPFAG